MADVILGQPYSAFFVIDDANGSPTTAADSVTGTMTVTGPGATSPAVTGAIGFLGNGGWGLAVPGSTLTAAGTWTFTVANLVVNGTSFGAQVGTFLVGLPQAGVRTLRDILVDLTIALGDGVQSVTTALGSPTTLVDSRWAGLGLNNELAGAEVLFLNKTSPATTDQNPVQVASSVAAAGILGFAPAQSGAVASGTPYLIGGRLYPTATKLAAIRQVLEDLGAMELVEDRVSVTSVLNQYEYAVPQPFYRLTEVAFQPQNTTQPTYWRPLVQGIFWEYRPDTRLLTFAPGVPQSLVRYRLRGLVEAQLPAQLTSLVPVRAATVVRLAEVYLKARGGSPQDRQEAQFLYQDLVRRGKATARAGRPV